MPDPGVAAQTFSAHPLFLALLSTASQTFCVSSASRNVGGQGLPLAAASRKAATWGVNVCSSPVCRPGTHPRAPAWRRARLALGGGFQEVGGLVDERVFVAGLRAGPPPGLHVGLAAVGD